jgi:hypothetical protein
MAQDLAQQIENFKSLPQKSLIENFQNFQDLNETLNSLTSPELTQQERVELSFALLKNLFLRDYFLQEYFYVLSLNMSQLTRATPNGAANP